MAALKDKSLAGAAIPPPAPIPATTAESEPVAPAAASNVDPDASPAAATNVKTPEEPKPAEDKPKETTGITASKDAEPGEKGKEKTDKPTEDSPSSSTAPSLPTPAVASPDESPATAGKSIGYNT